MALWGVGGSSTFCDGEPIIRDMVHDFSEDDEHNDNPVPTSSTNPNQSFNRVGQTIQFELCERMHFHKKKMSLYCYQKISHWPGLQICGCGVQDR